MDQFEELNAATSDLLDAFNTHFRAKSSSIKSSVASGSSHYFIIACVFVFLGGVFLAWIIQRFMFFKPTPNLSREDD